jgi:hypothetical protein
MEIEFGIASRPQAVARKDGAFFRSRLAGAFIFSQSPKPTPIMFYAYPNLSI